MLRVIRKVLPSSTVLMLLKINISCIISICKRGLEMEIVLAHPSLNSAGGGELVCLSLVKALRQEGHKVVVVTVDRTD